MRILVTGASGSGTTTLGRALSAELGWPVFDADHYYWLASDPPFQHKRDPGERLITFQRELERAPDAIVSGSIMNWGSVLEDSFELIVFLTLAAELRVARLEVRERETLGRVDHAFLEWAAQYDDGPPSGRSRARHEAWLAARAAHVLRIDGETSVAERVRRVLIARARLTRA
ncbi:MAG: AAA family ATPase [Kofleriaceae bacterium]